MDFDKFLDFINDAIDHYQDKINGVSRPEKPIKTKKKKTNSKSKLEQLKDFLFRKI